MATTPIPRALALIADDPNLAVEDALVDALAVMLPNAQGEALSILARRGHVPTLAGLVAKFSSYPPELQDLFLRHAHELHSGVRSAMESAELPARLSAVDMIVRGDDVRSAYVLAGALRSTCPQTREAAANALYGMTARFIEKIEARVATGRPDGKSTDLAEAAERRRALAVALEQAVRGWEAHFQTRVLEAALWLSAELESAIVEKLGEPRSRISHALQEILSTQADPRAAGFVLRALAIPGLRPVAARVVAQARNASFLRALARESGLLADPGVTVGCRWIHDCVWARIDGRWPEGVAGEDAARLVRLFAATGAAKDRKMTVLGSWLRSDDEAVQRSALAVLIADTGEGATRVLTEIGARSTNLASDEARREIQRRRRADGLGQRVRSSMRTLSGAAKPHDPVRDLASGEDSFDVFVEEFDILPPGERCLRADLFRNVDGDVDAHVLVRLRAKLASGNPLDRTLGLRIVRELGVTHDLAEQVYRLSHDGDAFVRSAAVAMLADLPGATSERILRVAVEDPDPRVQANAIEVLDRLDSGDRVKYTEPKLESRHHRVRANAVCSLLRLERRRAGEVLLDMMDDPAFEHRMSSLWVIERLRLCSAQHRVQQMSREDADERIRNRASRLLGRLTPYVSESALSSAGMRGAMEGLR